MPRGSCPECDGMLFGDCRTCGCGWEETSPLEKPKMSAPLAVEPPPPLAPRADGIDWRERCLAAARAPTRTAPVTARETPEPKPPNYRPGPPQDPFPWDEEATA